MVNRRTRGNKSRKGRKTLNRRNMKGGTNQTEIQKLLNKTGVTRLRAEKNAANAKAKAEENAARAANAAKAEKNAANAAAKAEKNAANAAARAKAEQNAARAANAERAKTKKQSETVQVGRWAQMMGYGNNSPPNHIANPSRGTGQWD